MDRFATYDAFLAERGIPLGPMIDPDGVFDVAFTVGDALIAVDIAKSCQMPIQGVDLWILTEGRLAPAYANCHVERDFGESFDDYVNRTSRTVVRYLNALVPPASGEFLVVVGTDPHRYGRAERPTAR
jgi:hypothetical protein